MYMRCVEATWTQEAESHGDTGSDKGGKGLAVRADCVAAFTGGEGVRGWVVEVEDEVAVVGYKGNAVDRFGGEDQFLD